LLDRGDPLLEAQACQVVAVVRTHLGEVGRLTQDSSKHRAIFPLKIGGCKGFG
jgi:hypothetical protein